MKRKGIRPADTVRIVLVDVDTDPAMNIVHKAFAPLRSRIRVELVVAGEKAERLAGWRAARWPESPIDLLLACADKSHPQFRYYRRRDPQYLRPMPALTELLMHAGRRCDEDSETLAWLVNKILELWPPANELRDLDEEGLRKLLEGLRSKARKSLCEEVAASLPAMLPDEQTVILHLAANRGTLERSMLDEALRKMNGVEQHAVKKAVDALKPLLFTDCDATVRFHLEDLAETVRQSQRYRSRSKSGDIHEHYAEAYASRLANADPLGEASLAEKAIWHGLQAGGPCTDKAVELFVYLDVLYERFGDRKARDSLLKIVHEAARRRTGLKEITELAEFLRDRNQRPADKLKWFMPRRRKGRSPIREYLREYLREYRECLRGRVFQDELSFERTGEIGEDLGNQLPRPAASGRSMDKHQGERTRSRSMAVGSGRCRHRMGPPAACIRRVRAGRCPGG